MLPGPSWEKHEAIPAPYYQAFGEATDGVMRCADCSRLVPVTVLKAKGLCPTCGTRRVKEVQSLSAWEWFRIWTGLLNFPHRLAFLREFNRG